MEFSDAFVRLQSDNDLAEKFIDDPEGVLSIMGVDTSKLVIQPIVGTTDEPLTRMKEFTRGGSKVTRGGSKEEPIGMTICASVGIVVCASVGGDIDPGDILKPIKVPPKAS
jgi:hypothetical protein